MTMVDFERARAVMVDHQVRTHNVTDRQLLAVLGSVPRERFVPENWRDLAYIDDAIPLAGADAARFLAPAAQFGKLVQLAEIAETDRVLDLGAGTGYSTAVLAGLASEVVGVEVDGDMATEANNILADLGITNAKVVQAPFDVPLKGEGEFDVVLIEGTVFEVPDSAFRALKDGGRLIALVAEGQGLTASAHIFAKVGKEIASRSAFNGSIPPLPLAKAPEQFVF